MIKISILKTAVLFHLLAALSLAGLDVSPEGAWTLEGISGSWRIAMPDWSRFLNAGTADFKTVAPGVGILTEQGKSMEFRSFCRQEGGESRFHSTLRSESFPEFGRLDYEIRIPDRAGLVRHSANPLFCAMPLLLDAAVSGFPLWRSHERFHGAISLPFRCKAIRYYAAWVPQGTRLRCSLRLTNVTARSFQVDILVADATGHLILSIEGWEEVGGRAGRTLRDFVMDPARYFITKPLPVATLLPIPRGPLPENTLDVRPLLGGDAPERLLFGALYVNDAPDFFTSNRGLWLTALAAAVLTRGERRDFFQMGGAAPRRLEWLLGRIAAKESVRRLLLAAHNLFEPSADIAVWKDDLGKPHPIGPWQDQVAAPIDLSIAHTAGLVLGAATTVGRIGLDVESTSRDLTEEFIRGVLTLEEQELATRSGDGPIAVLRFWCAKEAISKALGTGIRYAATDLRIRASDPSDGMLAVELLGAWAENFPALRGKRVPIKTAVLYDHAIACCLLPPF